jgi:hypothetical protein
MKVNILDAHDRFKFVKNQGLDISKTCQDMIDERPFGPYPFYIYGHTKTLGLDEKISLFQQDMNDHLTKMTKRKYKTLADVPEKRLIWQPRLTKPKVSDNTMLFKGYPRTDLIKVIWMLPQRELWEQYVKGNLTENETVSQSIYDYKNNREKLEAKEEDDLDDTTIDAIYRELAFNARENKLMARIYGV